MGKVRLIALLLALVFGVTACDSTEVKSRAKDCDVGDVIEGDPDCLAKDGKKAKSKSKSTSAKKKRR
jgi:hypothetical protein